jgi:hypothetical protein
LLQAAAAGVESTERQRAVAEVVRGVEGDRIEVGLGQDTVWKGVQLVLGMVI